MNYNAAERLFEEMAAGTFTDSIRRYHVSMGIQRKMSFLNGPDTLQKNSSLLLQKTEADLKFLYGHDAFYRDWKTFRTLFVHAFIVKTFENKEIASYHKRTIEIINPNINSLLEERLDSLDSLQRETLKKHDLESFAESLIKDAREFYDRLFETTL